MAVHDNITGYALVAALPLNESPARSSVSDGGDTVTSMDAARSSFSTDMMMWASEGTCTPVQHAQLFCMAA